MGRTEEEGSEHGWMRVCWLTGERWSKAGWTGRGAPLRYIYMHRHRVRTSARRPRPESTPIDRHPLPQHQLEQTRIFRDLPPSPLATRLQMSTLASLLAQSKSLTPAQDPSSSASHYDFTHAGSTGLPQLHLALEQVEEQSRRLVGKKGRVAEDGEEGRACVSFLPLSSLRQLPRPPVNNAVGTKQPWALT